MGGQSTECPVRKAEDERFVFLSWDVYLLLVLRPLNHRAHISFLLSSPLVLRLLDYELLGSPASGLVLNYTTGFLVLQLVDSRGLTGLALKIT